MSNKSVRVRGRWLKGLNFFNPSILSGVIENFEIVLDRAFELAKEADNADELLRMLDVLGMAATRTGNLRRILKNVEGDEADEWVQARDEAIKKLTEEWDLKSTIS